MFLGLRTVVYHVDDIQKAKEWYSKILDVKPYFDQLFYVGFNVGGFELGLQPKDKNEKSNTGVVAYWGVEDIQKIMAHLIAHGAQEHGAVRDVGEEVKVATVRDPFGNVFGIIYNPHFELSTK